MDLSFLRHPSAMIKIPELFMLIVSMATFFAGKAQWEFFASSIIIACFINALVLLVVYAMGYIQIRDTPMELLLYAFYTIGMFASSILLMSTNVSTFIASGVFCLFLCVVYCFDLYFAYSNLLSRPISFPSNINPPNPTDVREPSAPHETQYPRQADHMSPTPYLPPYIPPTDTVDYGNVFPNSSLYNTNPTYPTTLNYPPNDSADTIETKSSSYPPEDVTYGNI